MARRTHADLIKQRADDMLAVAKRFHSKPLGDSEPDPEPPTGALYPVSARELQWITLEPTASVTELPRARAQAVVFSGPAITAQNTPEALVVELSPRYYLVEPAAIDALTLYLLYVGQHANLVPEVIEQE